MAHRHHLQFGGCFISYLTTYSICSHQATQLLSGSNGVTGYQVSQSSSLYSIERFCVLLLHSHMCCSLMEPGAILLLDHVLHHYAVPETFLVQYE